MGEGSGLNDAYRRRHRWGSDRVIVPLKPGNAGGGKDPDFWCAFEDGEVRVIGDKPRNTRKGPDPSEEAVSRSQGETGPRMTLVSPARRMLAMKPVGKPDAGNPHVRFDERGRETGLVQRLATAPFLDSTRTAAGGGKPTLGCRGSNDAYAPIPAIRSTSETDRPGR